MPGTQELVHGTERGDRASFSSELTNARRIFPRDKGTVAAAPWARAANFVKKPPLIVNVTYLEFNGFDASMWVS